MRGRGPSEEATHLLGSASAFVVLRLDGCSHRRRHERRHILRAGLSTGACTQTVSELHLALGGRRKELADPYPRPEAVACARSCCARAGQLRFSPQKASRRALLLRLFAEGLHEVFIDLRCLLFFPLQATGSAVTASYILKQTPASRVSNLLSPFLLVSMFLQHIETILSGLQTGPQESSSVSEAQIHHTWNGVLRIFDEVSRQRVSKAMM